MTATLIVLLLLLEALPTWPGNEKWGYYLRGGVSLVLLILTVMTLRGAHKGTLIKNRRAQDWWLAGQNMKRVQLDYKHRVKPSIVAHNRNYSLTISFEPRDRQG